jgi:ribosome-associated protein
MSDNESLQLVAAVVEGALDRKAEDIVALDVRGLTSYTDAFVIATASSDRRARAIADSIAASVAKLGRKSQGVEGYDEGRWVLIDLGEVVVHVFQREVRDEYDLERLWSDAPIIPVADIGDRTAVR